MAQSPEERRAADRARYAANREKKKAQSRAYKAAHSEELRIKNAAYRKSNALKIATYEKDYALAHPEKGRIRSARYRSSNPDKVRANQKKYEAAHPERVAQKKREATARYRAAHPEKIRTYASTHPQMRYAIEARRRAQKKNAPLNDLTAAQWQEIQIAHNHQCAYCGKRAKGRLTQDHITPLSKGGSHTVSNIVPACRQCNSKKFVGPPPSPVQPLLLTASPAKKKGGKQ